MLGSADEPDVKVAWAWAKHDKRKAGSVPNKWMGVLGFTWRESEILAGRVGFGLRKACVQS